MTVTTAAERLVLCLLLCAASIGQASAQQTDREMIDELRQRLAASEKRIEALESKLATALALLPTPAAAPVAAPVAVSAAPVPANTPAPPANDPAPHDAMGMGMDNSSGGAHLKLPGGPVVNIRGFFDFNFGIGSYANPLVFPISNNGCGNCGNPVTPPHTTFQAGQFALFMNSQISNKLSFLAEVAYSPDSSNTWGLDVERYQLTYRWNRYLSASAGRMHTSIGYYNTAYHHGTWFSTAQGRPIMYLFEDSGGVLPVHIVGASVTGEVPGTEKLGLHWVAEVGNGRTSGPSTAPVQNFLSDRNYKAVNLAAYIRPDGIPGLQLGGSFYHDRLAPAGLPRVNQNIGSVYAAYVTPDWEFLNEAVLLSNHVQGVRDAYGSPMAYTQISRKFGIYRPYFRYQYVNDNQKDPVNILTGRYYGPSVGLRIDFTQFATFKLQYNRLFQSNQLTGNGLNSQIAFTF